MIFIHGNLCLFKLSHILMLDSSVMYIDCRSWCNNPVTDLALPLLWLPKYQRTQEKTTSLEHQISHQKRWRLLGVPPGPFSMLHLIYSTINIHVYLLNSTPERLVCLVRRPFSLASFKKVYLWAYLSCQEDYPIDLKELYQQFTVLVLHLNSSYLWEVWLHHANLTRRKRCIHSPTLASGGNRLILELILRSLDRLLEFHLL